MVRAMALPARVAALLIAPVLLTGGCLTRPAEPAKPTATVTPISQLDTSMMVIPRQAFCKEVPKKAIKAAIKGAVDNSREWTNGQQGVTGDVGQEFGCEWRSADGLSARAWVYARQVTPEFARQVIAKTSDKVMCRVLPPPHFGSPSQLQVCRLGGGQMRVRHAGLFGDAFLSCEVAEPTAAIAQLRARADAWCVDVAKALDTNE